jgi:thioredoxin-related protein
LNNLKLSSMKKVLFIALAVVALGLAYAFMPKSEAKAASAKETSATEGAINWMTWDEAIKANEKAPKKIFIDFYTDWCGWCKKMDKSTFSDPAVAEYVNKNFYAVKFNAEQKEDVVFQGNTFSWKSGGRNGVHTLAFELLDGRLGYPSYVYLQPTYERILISPGYKDVPMFQKELRFVSEEHFNTTTWEQFSNSN